MRTLTLPTLLLAAVLGACGGSDLVLPGSADPAELQVVNGDKQTARVGAALPESLAVRVVDATGRPVTGQAVAFVRDGATGGTVAPDTARTDSDGRAQARWVLGTVAGTQLARAEVPRTSGQPLTAFFTALATAAPTGGGGGTGGGTAAVRAAEAPAAVVLVVAGPVAGPVAGLVVAAAPAGAAATDPAVALSRSCSTSHSSFNRATARPITRSSRPSKSVC